MHRRRFIASMAGVAVTPHLLFSQQPKLPDCAKQPEFKVLNEDDYPSYDAFLADQYPLPKFQNILPIKVDIDFTYHLRVFKWNVREMSAMKRAALIFQTVWGSQEFKNKVTDLPPLILQDGTISGPELYKKLTSTNVIKMNIAVEVNLRAISIFGGENAVTGNNLTSIEKSYLDSKDTTIYDLCNTISHEYTHYTPTDSYDRGHSQNLRDYVSYGIGALTENMAAGRINNIRDPSISACVLTS